MPRTPEEETLLLAVKPGGWEYMLYAGILLREMRALEPAWRDHEIRYRRRPAGRLDEEGAHRALQDAFPSVLAATGNFNRLFEPQVMERAFGAPGEPGDADRIEHLAGRIVEVYRELLEWSARVRSTAVPDSYEPLFEVVGRFADGPIRQFREFVDELVEGTDRIPELLRIGEPVTLEFTLTLEVDDGVEEEFNRRRDEFERSL